MTAFLRGLPVALVAAAALLVGAAHPAAAATPCWKTLLNDWYDGRIDHTYPVSCYHQALDHLPTDVQTYSSAHDDIERALQSALALDRKRHRATGPHTLVAPSAKPVTTATLPASGATPASSTSTSSSTTTTTAVALPGNRPKGGLARLADRLNPSSPSALPVPLLVLGGLAILLVAAGGVGALAKRWQNRS